MKLPVSIIVLACALLSAGDDPVTPECTCKEIKLYGKVKIVEHFPDIEIQFVDNFPGLP